MTVDHDIMMDILGLNPEEFSKLSLHTAEDGSYDVEEAVAAYLGAFKTRQSTTKDIKAAQNVARTRLNQIETARLQIRAALVAGDLYLTDDVARFLQATFGNARSRLLGVPSGCARLMLGNGTREELEATFSERIEEALSNFPEFDRMAMVARNIDLVVPELESEQDERL
jgi:hypothetical protein